MRLVIQTDGAIIRAIEDIKLEQLLNSSTAIVRPDKSTFDSMEMLVNSADAFYQQYVVPLSVAESEDIVNDTVSADYLSKRCGRTYNIYVRCAKMIFQGQEAT